MTFDIELLNEKDIKHETLNLPDIDYKNDIIPQFKLSNYIKKYKKTGKIDNNDYRKI
jgi:hypothetical protein